MKKTTIAISLIAIFFNIQLMAQQDKWERFNVLIGKWEGGGEGFGNNKSTTETEFNFILGKRYIKVENMSTFEPTEKNKEGEIHKDVGLISYDKNRDKYVFRQFHTEGFVNQYVLVDSLSDKKTFVFHSEAIENFVEGGKAKYTIKVMGKGKLEAIFELSFPGKEFVCYGRNRLKRKKE